MKIIEDMVLSLLVCYTSHASTTVKTKTVQQGATVREPVLKLSALEMSDQLLTYYKDQLCAQYFCNNGTCHNQPMSVSQFQIYSEDLCLIIPNVNISNSGEYTVVLNGLKEILNLVLHVEVSPASEPTNLLWLLLVPLGLAFIAIIIVFKRRSSRNQQQGG